MSIYSMCPLVSSFSSGNYITSPFLVPSALKTLNNLSVGFILIFSSFTNYLSIPIWVYPESTSAFGYSSFLNVLTFVYMFNFLSLLSCWYRTIYWFWELLYTKLYHIVLTPNLQWNSFTYYHLYCLNFPIYFCSSYFILTYSFLLSVLLYHIYNTFWSLFLSLVFNNPLPYIYICCS